MLKHMAKHPSTAATPAKHPSTAGSPMKSPASPPKIAVEDDDDVVARLSCMLGARDAVHGAGADEEHLAVIDLARLPRMSAAAVSMLVDCQQSEGSTWAIPVTASPEKRASARLSPRSSVHHSPTAHQMRNRIRGSLFATNSYHVQADTSFADDAISEKEIKMDAPCVVM